MSGNKKDRKFLPEKKPLSHGWIVVPSKTYPDRVYFYNTVTKCSTWENPCESSRNKTSDQSSGESSSSSSRKRIKARRTSRKSSSTSQPKRSKTTLQSPGIDWRATNEIEDYDEQHDLYFENVPSSPVLRGHSSPPSSPDSVSSAKLNLSDAINTTANSGDDKKELWLHFASSPEKPAMKKSLALSDFDKPSTSSKSSGTEAAKRTPRSLSLLTAELSKKEIPSKARKKRKKKRAQSAGEPQRKGTVDKIINNVTFKRRDKTPAQSQLLKLRQQNAEMVKKLSSSVTNSCRKSVSPKFSSDGARSSGSQGKDESFSEVYLKRVEICNKELIRKAEDNSVTDFSEEMDWEPSSEELDVQNINEFRQKRDKADNISTEIFFGMTSDNTPSLPSQSNSWLLVLDTNIFVSCLSFIKEIRDTNVHGLGYPILYIPWRVLQELDHLKDSKMFIDKLNVDNQLQWNVRKAIAYLNDNFRSKHPRCFGQSFEDFAKMVDVETFAPDDEILQTCLQLKKLHPNKKLTLLTNDKNLESKAIVSGLDVYSKERFQKRFMPSDSMPGNMNNVPNNSEADATQIDNAVCAVKNILRNTFPTIVEEEMKIAFQEDWAKVAYRKPPWTLQDSMDCFTRHWRSVFFLVFPKEILSDVEKLYEKLFRREISSSEDVIETISKTQRLLTKMRKSLKKKRPYAELLDASVSKLITLLEEISRKRPPQVEVPVPSVPSQFSAANGSLALSNQTPVDLLTCNDLNETKNLFRDIWDSVRSFCCSVSDLINSSSTNNNVSIPEIRLKISQVLSELRELILTLGNIFEINLKDVHEGHPLVLHLSHFLVKVKPSLDPELRRKLPKCLAAFFADSEGRSLLGGSLADFREFSSDLVKAQEHFDGNYPTF